MSQKSLPTKKRAEICEHPGGQHLKEIIIERNIIEKIVFEFRFNLKLIKLVFSLHFNVLFKKSLL